MASDERAAGAGARAARPVRQAGECRPGDRAPLLDSSRAAAEPVAHTLLAEAYWRKFEYDQKDATLADRAGEEAGLALDDRSVVRARPRRACDDQLRPGPVTTARSAKRSGRSRSTRGTAARGASSAASIFGSADASEAEKEFRTAVTLDPDDWTAHNSLGALYLNLDRLDEAVGEFERMQALAPDNTRAYNNLGSAYLQQERFDKASEMYERSLSLDRNPTAYSNLGTALYQQGQYARCGPVL